MIEGWTPYPLWTYREYGCNQEVAGTSHRLSAIRSVLGDDFAGQWTTVERTAELIPEPDNTHDRYAVSVRVGNILIGYLPRDIAMLYARPLQRLLDRRQVPTARIEFTAHESQRWDRGYDEPPSLEFQASARLQLSEPHLIFPSNDPPLEDYTVLPAGYAIQVTRSEQHFDVLRHYVPSAGESWIIVTIHDLDVSTPKLARHVAEIRLDGKRIGQLTPATSLKYLPAVQHFAGRGLIVAARAVIRGSAVAATVSMFADKAYELTDEVLDGPPLTLPAIHGAQHSAGAAHSPPSSVAPTVSAPFKPPAPVRGTTSEGSAYTIAESAAGLSTVDITFARPFTPWQAKEAARVVDAARSKLTRAGQHAVADLGNARWSFSVTSADASSAVEAIAAVEESNFEVAKQYLLRH